MKFRHYGILFLLTILVFRCEDLPKTNPLHDIDLGRNRLSVTPLEIIGEAGADTLQFRNPRGITGDALGNIYIVDSGNHRIQVLDAQGRFRFQFGRLGSGDLEFRTPVDIAYNPRTNHLIISDYDNNRLKVYSTQGQLLNIISSATYTVFPLDGPWGLFVAETGKIYVTNIRGKNLIEFANEDMLSWRDYHADSEGNPFMTRPLDVVIVSGSFVISDYDRHQLVEIAPAGGVFYLKYFAARGSEANQLFRPSGLSIDRRGYIFVAEAGNQRIQVFTGNVGYVGHWSGVYNIKFRSPQGLYTDKQNRLCIADTGNHRIVLCGYEIMD